MKKPNIFAQKRLTNFAKETPDHVVSSAQEEAEKRVSGIEADLQAGKNVEQATEAAKFFVREAGRNATAKLQADWDLRNKQTEYVDFIGKVKQVVDTAMKQIDKNRERYDKIAAFVAKKTEMEDMLRRNSEGFESQVRGRHDLNNLAVLETTADSLANTQAAIAAMEAPDMENERTALTTAIEAQIQDFLAEADATLAFHKKQIEEATQYLTDIYKPLTYVEVEDKAWGPKAEKAEDLNVRDEAGWLVGEARPPNGRTSRFHDQTARKAMQYLVYIKEIRTVLGGLDGEDELKGAAAKAEGAAAKAEPLLIMWDDKHYLDRGRAHDQRKRAWVALPALEANLAKARANLAELERKGASAKERQKASQWIAGALENVQKQLTIVRDTVYNDQTAHGELEEEGPLMPLAVATRWGTTEVERIQSEERAAPETVEPPETAPPRVARAESDKKKRGRKPKEA